MRRHPWETTPLGAPRTWPQSLRSLVSTCLNCSFPILLWWGRDLVKLYNDAYSSILGDKHPRALGRAGEEVWPEIWDTIGPMLARVTELGEAVPADDLLLLLRRRGYAEECYFSFSYSPIHVETGAVGGVFCPVIETTEKVIGARRQRTISALGAIERPESAVAAAAACAAVLAQNPADLPFALIYVFDHGDSVARLSGAAGIAPPMQAAPETIALTASDGETWPIGAVPAGGLALQDLPERFPALPTGAWSEPPREALLLPVTLPGEAAPAAVLVTGLNPHKRLDESYRGFLEVVTTQLAGRIADAVALAAERRRAEALAALDHAKMAFFSNVSHEFRTPLTLMLGPLEEVLALPEHLAAADRGRIEVAHRNAMRLLRLVNALLDFSRVESGLARARPQPTDLAGYTAELASTFRSLCERAGLTLVIDCPPLPQPVHVDPEMWEKVVLNLLSNAFKFTLQGKIVVAVRRSADGRIAELEVHDTGTGIPAEDVPRLFERFHRVEGTTGRSIEGSGIGLALVREAVRLHGGDVSVASEVGRGSRFTVSLPFPETSMAAAPPTVPAPPERIAARAQAFVEEARRWLPRDSETPSGESVAVAIYDDGGMAERAGPEKAARILVADDNADMRDYVARLLVAKGYEVEAVANGAAALAAARRQRPDLVLSDVMMPVLDGVGLLQAVRADRTLQDLPVVLLSARAGEESRIEGLDSGADDYLVKPFSARELLARVRANVWLGELRRHAQQDLERLVAERTRERDRVWQNSRDLLVVIGADGIFRDVNPAWGKILGHAPEEVVGRNISDFVLSEDEWRTWEALHDAASTGDLTSFENRQRRKDGGFRWISWLTAVENDLIYAYGRDVTEQKEQVEALRKAEETLRQSQKMDAIGQLTGGIAHDFNNLLTGIAGSLELMQTRIGQGRTGDLDRYIIAAQGAAKRAASLTHRLLAFSRRQALDPRAINVTRLIRGIEELIRRTIGPAITLEVVSPAKLWTTLVDPNQLENALLNLCINARDAMPAGGRLTLEAGNRWLDPRTARELDLSAGQYVSIAVTDTGSGMTPEVIARAFDPFFTTKPLGMGTGLGLSMVYGFVRQTGGQARIYSEAGQGTVVTLYLPRHHGVEDQGEEEDTAANRISSRDGETVLVVDDEPTIRMLIADTLGELGYAVIATVEGAGALKVLHSNARVDLLITDIGLPGGINGRELAAAGRDLRPDLKVLLITGYAESAIVDEGALEEGMRLLPKPFAMEELAERIKELFGR